MQPLARRGLLIVLEGCDRTGKTTICSRLVRDLTDEKHSTKSMAFPDRSTTIGSLINEYLRQSADLSDQSIHLLFSANRWELEESMRNVLMRGTNLVIDRYAFSGVAFSAAKAGLSLEWCKQPDRGLPMPDLVCYLDVSPDEAVKRGGFGEERYEKRDFQERVRSNYRQLMDETWRVVDTDGKTLDQVYTEVKSIVMEAIKSPEIPPVDKLWVGQDCGGKRP